VRNLSSVAFKINNLRPKREPPGRDRLLGLLILLLLGCGLYRLNEQSNAARTVASEITVVILKCRNQLTIEFANGLVTADYDVNAYSAKKQYELRVSATAV
jgi:hypothetical protein